MDLQYVLLNPNGRIAQREFWIGVGLLICGNVLSGMIPALGGLIWLFLIYVGVCVYGKRLHDTGRSAWLHLVPWAITLALTSVGGVLMGGAILTAFLAGDDFNPLTLFTAGSGLALMMGLSNLVWLIYTLWVGLSAGQAGANAYGPAPIRILTAEPPAPSDEQG